MVLRMLRPGVVTAMSIAGNFDRAHRASPATAVRLAASHTAADADPPFFRMPAAVASAPSASRSAQSTTAPSAARASADDFPMPDAAPSTTALFPERSNNFR